MTSFREDPINEAIYGKRGLMGAIDLLFDNDRIIPGIMMVMCGIDIMSNLDRTEDDKENNSEDFRRWVTRYVRVPGGTELTADDIWEARNALLHTYGVFSKRARAGKGKVVIWLQNPLVPVGYAPDVDPRSIRVDPFVFKRAFREGVQEFLCRGLGDPERKPIIERRLKQLVTYSQFIDRRLSTEKS